MTDKTQASPIKSGFDAARAKEFARSELFERTFKDGMGLVEETAAYLDGPGRAASKRLSRAAALAYAGESMRLTTRLMQLASWLLLQRAANSGEMTRDQVASEKVKVRLDTASASEDVAGWSELPEEFRDLVKRSLRLQARVRRMDEEIYGAGKVTQLHTARHGNPVNEQIRLLNTAFARG